MVNDISPFRIYVLHNWGRQPTAEIEGTHVELSDLEGIRNKAPLETSS